MLNYNSIKSLKLNAVASAASSSASVPHCSLHLHYELLWQEAQSLSLLCFKLMKLKHAQDFPLVTSPLLIR